MHSNGTTGVVYEALSTSDILAISKLALGASLSSLIRLLTLLVVSVSCLLGSLCLAVSM
jgi:hypothetical protein